MDKTLQTRITLQPYHSISHLNLTNLPVGNLRNPGIGLKIFDVMVPLYGTEKFEQKKEDEIVTGSFTDSTNVVHQEGFGNLNLPKEIIENNDSSQIAKLGPVFNAMQKVKLTTNDFLFQPQKSKKTPLNIAKKTLKSKVKQEHKFSLL